MITFATRHNWSVCWIALLGLTSVAQGAAPSAKILVVGTLPDHPWASHMYEFDGKVLAECLRRTEGIEADSVVGWPVAPEQLNPLSALVFYSRPAGELVLHPDHRQRFEALMDRGAGFVAIHWGTGVGYSPLADEPEIRESYKNVLGGWFRHPPCDIVVGRAQVLQADKTHPICRGWSPFMIRDEFYLNPVLHAQAHSVLEVDIKGESHTVAWTFERPGPKRGRSVGITLGHSHASFEREDFRRALVNAILWSAHRDVPPNGAPVEMDSDRVRLPDPPASATNP